MGKRGPKPKPTLLKILEGNPACKPLNPAEPECEYWPVKPSLISADQVASTEWDRLAAVVPPKLYTAMDEAVLTQYCLAWSAMTAAQLEISARGIIIENPIVHRGEIVGTEVKANPAVAAWARANEILFKTGDRLGLSPSTRARINFPSPEEVKNKFKGLLGRGDGD